MNSYRMNLDRMNSDKDEFRPDEFRPEDAHVAVSRNEGHETRDEERRRNSPFFKSRVPLTAGGIVYANSALTESL